MSHPFLILMGTGKRAVAAGALRDRDSADRSIRANRKPSAGNTSVYTKFGWEKFGILRPMNRVMPWSASDRDHWILDPGLSSFGYYYYTRFPENGKLFGTAQVYIR